MTRFRNVGLLIQQETRTTKLFLAIFYFGAIVNLIFACTIHPFTHGSSTTAAWSATNALVIALILLPIAFFFIRRNSPRQVRYIYYVVFTVTNIVNDAVLYWGQGRNYSAGNAVEILFILFAPMFLDNAYLVVVSLGTIIEYAFIGGLLHAPQALIAIVLIVMFAIVAFILLNRFKSYATTIEQIHEQQLNELVTSVVSILELKDPYTRGHSERVARYATFLAKSCNQFTQDELRLLYHACLLHDIGKMGVPDSVLTKPGKLTADEYEIIKMHPVIGADAIRQIEGLEACIDVVRYHHERWDGEGYPDKLKGMDIPFMARITAIVDAFDAMTSSRAYRPAMSPEQALDVIMRERGKQFDPQLVDEFEKVFPQFLSYLDSGLSLIHI